METLSGNTENISNGGRVMLPDELWQRVSGCCMSADGVLCCKLCHKSEGTCTQGTPRWWQCSCLRLQEIDRREGNYKETQRERAWKRETAISFSSLLSMMNQLRRGHLTPVTQPARHNYLQGEDGGLAGRVVHSSQWNRRTFEDH